MKDGRVRNVTQADVAAAAGVSRGLVSLALADSPRVAPETKARILSVVQELGYTKNYGAAVLASRRNPTIAMIVPDLINPYFDRISSAVQTAGESRGLTTLLATASGDPRRERRLLEQFEQMRVAGIILVTPSVSMAGIDKKAVDVPVVVAGSPFAPGAANVVHMDEDRAASLAVRHGLSAGVAAITYVVTGDGRATAYRRRAIEAACEEAGVPLSVARPDALTINPCGGAGHQCLIVHNDFLAIDVIAECRSRGVVPGRDITIISYDNTYLADHPQFRMTSIDQNPAEQARLILESLAERGSSGRDIVVEPRLIVRGTSGLQPDRPGPDL